MARFGVSLPPSIRRTMMAGALVVGAFTAFAPSVHAAFVSNGPGGTCTNPAGPPSVTPSPLDNPSNSVTTTAKPGDPNYHEKFFASGTITVTVDGAKVSFTANGSDTPSFTQVGTLANVQAGGCSEETTNPNDVSFTGGFTLNDGTPCTFSNQGGNTTFQVDSLGDDTLRVGLQCGSMSGTFVVKGSGSAEASGSNGSTNNTPELGSGELLATGLVPALGIILFRRRRQRRAGK